MNHAKTLLITLLLGGATLLPARLSAQEATGPGLIGKRHYGADVSYEQFRGHRYDQAFGASGNVNLPMIPGIDAAFSFGTAHTSGANMSLTQQTLTAAVLAYNDSEYGKTFFAGTIGQAWGTAKLLGVESDRDDTFWMLGIGLEAPWGNTTAITYGLNYCDSFKSDGRSPTWQYRLQASHWFTARVCGVATLSYNQIKHAPDSVLCALGVRVTF
jgi:hypothetical protein